MEGNQKEGRVMFTNEQTKALEAPLDSKHVKSRSQAGRSLSYIEGWHAIAEANRIFGFDGWDRETVELRQLGEPREVNGKMRVAYMARVKVAVRTPEDMGQYVIREGTGYGSGIAQDLGDAFESAIKEAETDAMKRALMTFGNPFGLALYDKEQRGVTNGGGQEAGKKSEPASGSSADDSPPPAVTKWVTDAKLFFKNAESVHELATWAKDNKALAKLKANHPAQHKEVIEAYERTKLELTEIATGAAA